MLNSIFQTLAELFLAIAEIFRVYRKLKKFFWKNFGKKKKKK